MIIKQPALATHLKQHLANVYVLIGQDPFLLNNLAEAIKQAWATQHKNTSMEQSILHLAQPADWQLLQEEANSYSLFAREMLIDARYEKKKLRAGRQRFFQHLP